MKADFSGYATRSGIECSDGRTIMPDAFKHQDKVRVPLVWQHGHDNPENVLGHCILENRDGDVYTYGFFNETPKAKHAKMLLEHGDINALSIWANKLVEKAKRVFHGSIREVSLVLAGANPGALIENVTIRHGDFYDTLDDEAIIHTGLELETPDSNEEPEDNGNEDPQNNGNEDPQNNGNEDPQNNGNEDPVSHADNIDDETVQEVYESMTDIQKNVLHYMVDQALNFDEPNPTNNTAEHSNTNDPNKEGKNTMGTRRNVFEQGENPNTPNVLSHSEMTAIIEEGKSVGSMRKAVEAYALAHNITDIDQLFPDPKMVGDVPEWNKRRTEWVGDFIGSLRKSPFSRIKTMYADITEADARAKGYIKGRLKKEEFFSVARRITNPTTVYKKQALDRDDVLDITDFDVVAWMKGEMRFMLEEELARAILFGDGRDIASEDKIDEQSIRPIAKDHELYTTVVNVNVGDANSSMQEVIDAIILNRSKLKGSGTPNFYTTEVWIGQFLLMRDGNGRRLYRTLEELAMELRVAKIVPVEVMEDEEDIIGVLVNPIDYVLGSDRGGQTTMFEDFDIDYNKQKYLIETRVSGALARLKSAMVVKAVASTDVLATPVKPTFDAEEGELTIPTVTGVVYKHGSTTVNAAGSPYTVDPGTSWTITATPASGYYFASSDGDEWTFTADEA